MSCIIFPELEKEMKENRYSIMTLATDAGMSYPTMYKKLTDGSTLKYDDALKIKHILKSKKKLEDLFVKVVI